MKHPIWIALIGGLLTFPAIGESADWRGQAEKWLNQSLAWWEMKCSRRVLTVCEITLPEKTCAELDWLDETFFDVSMRPSPDEAGSLRLLISETDGWETDFLLSVIQPFTSDFATLSFDRDHRLQNNRRSKRRAGNIKIVTTSESIPIAGRGSTDLGRRIAGLLKQVEGVEIKQIQRIYQSHQSRTYQTTGFTRPSRVSISNSQVSWELQNPYQSETNSSVRPGIFVSTVHEVDSGERIVTLLFLDQIKRNTATSLIILDSLFLGSLMLIFWLWKKERKMIGVIFLIYIIVGVVATWPVWFPSNVFAPLEPGTFTYLCLIRGCVLIPAVLSLVIRSFPTRIHPVFAATVVLGIAIFAIVLTRNWQKKNSVAKASSSTGFYTNVYVVPPTFTQPTPNGERITAKVIFDRQGIVTDSAVYYPTTSQIIVRALPEQMKRVEAYLDSRLNSSGMQVYIIPSYRSFTRDRFSRLFPELEKKVKGTAVLIPAYEALTSMEAGEFQSLPTIMIRPDMRGSIELEGMRYTWFPTIDSTTKHFGLGLTVDEGLPKQQPNRPDVIARVKRGHHAWYASSDPNTDEIRLLRIEQRLVDPAGQALEWNLSVSPTH